MAKGWSPATNLVFSRIGSIGIGVSTLICQGNHSAIMCFLLALQWEDTGLMGRGCDSIEMRSGSNTLFVYITLRLCPQDSSSSSPFSSLPCSRSAWLLRSLFFCSIFHYTFSLPGSTANNINRIKPAYL